MKNLIERSYKAIRERGLITNKTTTLDFIKKLNEEMHECAVAEVMYRKLGNENYIEELTDLATVAIMQIYHLGYDFIKEFEKVVLKNEKRAKSLRVK